MLDAPGVFFSGGSYGVLISIVLCFETDSILSDDFSTLLASCCAQMYLVYYGTAFAG
jgi:hypothetical protein